MEEGRLAGGWMHGARRVGDTVRRPLKATSGFVHSLLRLLEDSGFDGAPRLLGVDGDEEVLTYVAGFVPVETDPDGVPSWVWSDQAVGSAFGLVRRYHDVTSGSALAGRQEVVRHGDLSPWNTVYRDGRAVALLDWDDARPGDRLADVGYALWRHLRLGLPGGPDPGEAARQMAVALDAYGLSDRQAVVAAIAGEQARHRRWFEARAADGDPLVTRLIGLGALDYIDSARDWLSLHGAGVQASLAT